MLCLSVIQPWATAVVLGIKQIETRSWSTSYRGRIAIHASMKFPRWAKTFAEAERAIGRIPESLPFGAIIGFVVITGMKRTELLAPEISDIERLYGDYSFGRWGWLLTDNKPLIKPIQCKGSLGLWEVPDGILKYPMGF